MAEISDMDWAQHIKMDYAQNLRKDSNRAKKGPSQNFYRVLSAHFAVLQYYKEFAAILSNLFKTAILKNVLGIRNDVFSAWIFEVGINLGFYFERKSTNLLWDRVLKEGI